MLFIALHMISGIMVNISDESRLYHLAFIWGKGLTLSMVRDMMVAVSFSQICFSAWENVFFCFFLCQFAEFLNHEKVLLPLWAVILSLMLYIAWIDFFDWFFWMLNQSYIPWINLTWSWCINFQNYYWILSAKIFQKDFSISSGGVWYAVFCSNLCQVWISGLCGPPKMS